MDEKPKCDCGMECAAHHPDMPGERRSDKATCSCEHCATPAMPAG